MIGNGSESVLYLCRTKWNVLTPQEQNWRSLVRVQTHTAINSTQGIRGVKILNCVWEAWQSRVSQQLQAIRNVGRLHFTERQRGGWERKWRQNAPTSTEEKEKFGAMREIVSISHLWFSKDHVTCVVFKKEISVSVLVKVSHLVHKHQLMTRRD